jgi:hypothetical protein
MGKRPDVSIRLKTREGGDKEYPVAFWKQDNGGLSGRLAEGWSFVSPSGESFTTGKEGNCYLDCYLNDGEGDGRQSLPQSRQQAPRGGRPPQGRGQGGSRDFPGNRARRDEDDDIPF